MSEPERLYAMLPSVYRRRDAEQGEPLRALLAIVERQFAAIEADTETTWDNWFVETAEEWLVPYLGQALGLPVTRDVTAIAFSRRAFVANAIRYRRAKGTLAMLELLARDVTNYPARAVEYYTRVAWSEAINHRTGRRATLDIRNTPALERIGSPFGEAMRTADVRGIASRRGLHNLPNLGLFMWRTVLWRLGGADAEVFPDTGGRGWRFRPVGGDRPLYAPLQTELDPAALADEASVPLALSRRRLWAQAERLGAAMVFPFDIAVEGSGADGAERRPVPRAAIDICNLETIPADSPADRVLVDPQRGALILGDDYLAGLSDVAVVTSHFFAAPGTLGAGPWSREAETTAWLTSWTAPPEARPVTFQMLVARDAAGPETATTLEAAVERWNAFLAGLPAAERSRALGLILVGDSRTHAAPATTIDMPAGAVLGLVAARWPQVPSRGGALVRRIGDIVADELRPVIRGGVRVAGQGAATANRGELYVSGLYLDGGIAVEAGSLQALRLASTTLLAAIAIDSAGGANAGLEVRIDRSIVAGIQTAGAIARLAVADSAVTGPLGAPLAAADLVGATVTGPVTVSRLDATDCLFDAHVEAEEQQRGCVRFTYLPPNSRTPRRFRCQPDLALDDAGPPGSPAAERVRLRMRPQFHSRDPHAPGFLLLVEETPAELRGAAEDGGEPGAWNHLQHGVRVANLTRALPQFMRFGLEPGLFFLT